MNLKKSIFCFLFASLLAGAAFAQSDSSSDEAFAELDTNSDGKISVEEATGTWLASTFNVLDVNQDGVVSKAEYKQEQ